MLLTTDEYSLIQDRIRSYQPERERLQREVDSATDPEEREQLRKQQQELLDKIEGEIQAYSDKLQRERFKQIESGGAEGIIASAKELAPAILETIYRNWKTYFKGEDAETINKSTLATMKGGKIYINASFADIQLREELRLHIEALKDNEKAQKQLFKIIKRIVTSSPYIATTETTITDSAIFNDIMPTYHSKAADILASLSREDIYIDKRENEGILKIESEKFALVLKNYSELKINSLGMSTHKLLMVAMAEFTRLNRPDSRYINAVIKIPFNEYARALKKEKKWKESDSKNARKRIKKDLEILLSMCWTWKEDIKGKAEDFTSINIIDRVELRNGYIIIVFGLTMATYLARLPIFYFPKGLLSIDERNETAYRIGLKLAEHHSILNNQKTGTAGRLRVSTLLAVTKLPTLESLQQEKDNNQRQWNSRIKEPFETALDRLTGKVIKNWEYVKAKGEPLTDEQAYNITDYDTFTGLLIQFELLET